jgi:hypothetical protein
MHMKPEIIHLWNEIDRRTTQVCVKKCDWSSGSGPQHWVTKHPDFLDLRQSDMPWDHIHIAAAAMKLVSYNWHLRQDQDLAQQVEQGSILALALTEMYVEYIDPNVDLESTSAMVEVLLKAGHDPNKHLTHDVSHHFLNPLRDLIHLDWSAKRSQTPWNIALYYCERSLSPFDSDLHAACTAIMELFIHFGADLNMRGICYDLRQYSRVGRLREDGDGSRLWLASERVEAIISERYLNHEHSEKIVIDHNGVEIAVRELGQRVLDLMHEKQRTTAVPDPAVCSQQAQSSGDLRVTKIDEPDDTGHKRGHEAIRFAHDGSLTKLLASARDGSHKAFPIGSGSQSSIDDQRDEPGRAPVRWRPWED